MTRVVVLKCRESFLVSGKATDGAQSAIQAVEHIAVGSRQNKLDRGGALPVYLAANEAIEATAKSSLQLAAVRVEVEAVRVSTENAGKPPSRLASKDITRVAVDDAKHGLQIRQRTGELGIDEPVRSVAVGIGRAPKRGHSLDKEGVG